MSFMKRDSQTAPTPPTAAPDPRKQLRLKKVIAVTISPEWIAWIDHEVRAGTFRSRSHAIEFCIKNTALATSQATVEPHRAP